MTWRATSGKPYQQLVGVERAAVVVVQQAEHLPDFLELLLAELGQDAEPAAHQPGSRAIENKHCTE